MKMKLLIADTDASYTQRLIEELEKDDNLILSLFDSKDDLSLSLQTKKYDIALFSRSMLVDNYSNILMPFYLLDENVGSAGVPESFLRIEKYQPISLIKRSILRAYSEVAKEEALFTTDEGTSICAVYSPVGGAGTTTVACAAAFAAKMHGSRSLLISLEQISSFPAILPQNDNQSMAELFLGGNIGNFAAKLQSLENVANDITYLNPFFNMKDVLDLTAEDISDFLTRLAQSGRYDVIFVDTDSVYSALNQVLFETADSILLVTAEQSVSTYKTNALLDNMLFQDSYGEKVRIVVNRALRKNTSFSAAPVVAQLDYLRLENQLEVASSLASTLPLQQVLGKK